MFGLDNLETLFVVSAFSIQLMLIIHFAVRKWRFSLARRYGWIVYAFSLPFAIASIIILHNGKAWPLWLGGFIYLAWAIYGYIVEYVQEIEWRNSLRWPILVPFVILYLATVMFYWWPLALVYKPLWYIFTLLFLIGTYLNVTSHKAPGQARAT